ncbi:MAG: glycosyltransferase, partial [Actinomycetota bacterium]
MLEAETLGRPERMFTQQRVLTVHVTREHRRNVVAAMTRVAEHEQRVAAHPSWVAVGYIPLTHDAQDFVVGGGQQFERVDTGTLVANGTVDRATPARRGGLEQEGFGIVFAEAAACAVPQIAGDSGGAAEAVVDGETGMVVC